jgi:NitT/TauT family transport system substrate-binding protein
VTISITVANIQTQTYLSLVLAQQLGYFKQQGINVKIVNVASAQETFPAMLAGQVEGVAGFYDHEIDLRAKGADTEAVIQLNQAPGFVMMVRTSEASTITSPAQLTGKKIGVNGLGSSNEFIADYLAVHAGVAVSTLHPLAVQAGPPSLAAMQHGTIDAIVTTEPTISALLAKKDAVIIEDMRSLSGTQAALGGNYPGTAIAFKTAWVNSNKATVQRLVNALVEALHFIQQHSAAQIVAEVPPSYYATTGKAAYTEALANEIGIYSPTGLMPVDGPESIQRVLSAFDPALKGKTVNLSQTYTEQFVQNATS